MLLVTTKTSNILEDLETLRLFSRVVSPILSYCRSSSLDWSAPYSHTVILPVQIGQSHTLIPSYFQSGVVSPILAFPFFTPT